MTVKSIGRGGGLALLCMNDANVEVRSFSKNHIDVMIGELKKKEDGDLQAFMVIQIRACVRIHGTCCEI